jgi:hypothetical protein
VIIGYFWNKRESIRPVQWHQCCLLTRHLISVFKSKILSSYSAQLPRQGLLAT